MKRYKAVVIGLGETGRPLKELLEEAYEDEVKGIDKIKGPRDQPGSTFEFMHICFPQGLDFKEEVRRYTAIYDPSYLVVHSTLYPGTMNQLARRWRYFAESEPLSRQPSYDMEMLNSCKGLFYSPIRGNTGDGMKWGLKTYKKFIASAGAPTVYGKQFESSAKGRAFRERLEAEANRSIIKHFKKAGITAFFVADMKTLEYAKNLNLAYYATCISFFQELERIVENRGLNHAVITKFISSTEADAKKGGRSIPRPLYYGGYIGGHCVIPAIGRLIAEDGAELFKAVLHSNIKRERELAK